MLIASSEITGLVLAGGRGSRMGHVDKGLQSLRGYPMVLHVLTRLAPQVGPILISANQNAEVYGDLGYPVFADLVAGFAGPLAGVHTGLSHCETPYLLAVPCDSPFLPGDLALRLGAALAREDADIAVASTQGQAHPVFSLIKRPLLAGLGRFLDQGGRKFESWLAAQRSVTVNFDDEADAFRNINTLAELRESDH